jgi:hypothetical protein
MQIRQVSVRLFRWTDEELRVCIADKNYVKVFQIEVQDNVFPVHIRVEIELH